MLDLREESEEFVGAVVRHLSGVIFVERKAGKDTPQGFKQFGKWHPNVLEHSSCCDAVRSPSKAHPFSLYRHCLTRKHIETRLRQEIKAGPFDRSHSHIQFALSHLLALLEEKTQHPRSVHDLEVVLSRSALEEL